MCALIEIVRIVKGGNGRQSHLVVRASDRFCAAYAQGQKGLGRSAVLDQVAGLRLEAEYEIIRGPGQAPMRKSGSRQHGLWWVMHLCWIGILSMPCYAKPMIPIRDIAQEVGLDRSHAHKLAKRLRLEVANIRDGETGQMVSAVSEADADTMRAYRKPFGEGPAGKSFQAPQSGVFYIVVADPQHAPLRVKMGFTASLGERVREYRCLAPEVKVVAKWPSRRAWERAAMDAITNDPRVSHLKGEVYDVESLDVIIERGSAFFAMLESEQA